MTFDFIMACIASNQLTRSLPPLFLERKLSLSRFPLNPPDSAIGIRNHLRVYQRPVFVP